MNFFRMILTLCISLLNLAQALPDESVYLSHRDFTDQIKLLARANPNLVRYESIGKTVQGRDIWSLTITNFKLGNPAGKGAICVVANLTGTYLSGSHVALETARHLLAQYGKVDSVTQLLDQRIFYFIPSVNADAAERYFQRPQFESATNLTPVDSDFDALVDEDGPEDLNDDGLITLMRIPDVKGNWIMDSTDTRLLRQVGNGELGRFRLETEGIDNDGDELFNEDPVGGVNLNMNFPHLYPQYEPGAGPFMLSERESRAVVKFFVSRPNIVFTIIYDSHDNLLVTPQAEKNDSSSKNKVAEKIAAADEFIFRMASELYRQKTQLKIKPELKESPGSLAQWLYFQQGIPAFCVRPWWPVSPPDSAAAQPETSEKTPAKAADKKDRTKTTSADLDWLKWVDHAGEGFIPWQAFNHPQLGAVEIGGFRPFLKTTPPARLLPAWTIPYIDFTLELSHLLPEIKLAKVEIEKHEKSVFLLKIEVQKTGFFPVCTAFAHDNHLGRSILARVKLNGAILLTGTVNVVLPQLALNKQTETVEWQFFAPKPTQIELEILTEKAGKIRREITLE